MAYRLLNSNTDPQRIIRALPLSRDLRLGLQTCLKQIWTADNIIDLTQAHGRALGVGTGLAWVSALTPTQFTVLADAFTRAFEDRLTVLTGQAAAITDPQQQGAKRGRQKSAGGC
jgi:hypothetical protein